jgi:hypothetical protein
MNLEGPGRRGRNRRVVRRHRCRVARLGVLVANMVYRLALVVVGNAR